MSVFPLQKTKPLGRADKFRQYFNLLSVYLRPQGARVVLMSVLLLAGIALQLVNPQVIRFFLDTAQAGGSQRALFLAAVIFILFALLQQGLRLAAGYASQVVSWAATNHLRADLALHLLRLGMSFHKRVTPGEIVERVDGDVTQLANFFSELVVSVIGNILLVVGILALLFREDLRVGLSITLYTLLTLAMLGLIQRMAVSRWAQARQASAEQYGYLEERISGAEDIRTSGAEAYAIRRLLRLMRVFLVKNRAAFVVGSLAYNLTGLLYVIGYAFGLALGVYLFTQGVATLGAAYLITNYVGMLSDPLQALRKQAQDLQQAEACIQRVQDLFDLPQEAQSSPAAPRPVSAFDPKDGQHLPAGPLSVEFDQVSFHYDDDEDVLKDIHFALGRGKVLGVLGRTGSGKSTLTRLLFRLYDPTQGIIRLEGLDLRDLPLAEVRRRVGMVTQDVQLFQASLRDNLTFFDAAIPDERLEAVLRALGMGEWLQSHPRGLDTILNAGGQGLSAGEAQLLAFARVFLKDPGLVILDEASSRLDPSTETRLEQAIDWLFAPDNRPGSHSLGRTGIIIAHRLKTVQRADDILILEDGRVVEYGPRLALAADPRSRFSGLLKTGLEEVLAA